MRTYKMKKKAILGIILALVLVPMLLLTGCMEEDPGYAIVVDADGNVLTIDEATGAIISIDYEHHEIHKGDHFTCGEVVDLPMNSVLDIQITTPNTTEWAHMTAEFDVEAATEWWVYENVTINVAGVAAFEWNNNRNSLHVNTTQIAAITNADIANANADTAIAGATLLYHGMAGAGKKIGGQGGSRQEIILEQNQDYTIRFEAGAAGFVDYLLRWYEYTSK